MNRVASTTVSLSWVFMVIVGGFFILLSYNVVTKYQENEEAKFEIELKQALRAILNNVGRTTGVEENSLEPIGEIFRNSKVELLCEAGIPIMSINGNLDPNNNFLRNYPSFMTYIDEGDVSFTYLAVENFKMPFKINNMLGIVSRKNLIVFDNDSDVGAMLIDKFNRGSYVDLNYIVRDFDDLNSLGAMEDFWDEFSPQRLNSVAFVTDSGRPLLDLSPINRVSHQIVVESADENYGRILYYDGNGAHSEFRYVDHFDSSFQSPGLNLVTMAIFSTPETFECSYNMLIDNSENVFNFYIEKAETLMKLGETEKLCSSAVSFDDSEGNLVSAQQIRLYEDLRDDLVVLRDIVKTDRFNNPEDVILAISEIERSSDVLEEFSCVYVY